MPYNAKDLVDEYIMLNKIKRLDTEHYPALRTWVENKVNKIMDRPLFVTRGSGGGQKYRIWWLVFNVLGNRNKRCYYYTETTAAEPHLRKYGHLSLQDWLDDPSHPQKYKNAAGCGRQII
jgi:hypothetical protein